MKQELQCEGVKFEIRNTLKKLIYIVFPRMELNIFGYMDGAKSIS